MYLFEIRPKGYKFEWINYMQFSNKWHAKIESFALGIYFRSKGYDTRVREVSDESGSEYQ